MSIFQSMMRRFFSRGRLRTASNLAQLALLAVGVLLLGAPAEVSGQSTPDPLQEVTLQLKWKHQFQFAGYYAAQAQNYYRDAGLNVRIIEAQESVDPIGEVVDGHADFGVGTSELLLWRSQGKPVVILGVVFQHSPLVLLTAGESNVDTLHGLVGKRVAIEKNSAELLGYLQDEGISVNQLQMQEHEFDPSALLDGSVDAMSAYSTDEPFLLQTMGHDYQIYSPRSGGIDFYGDVLFTTQDEIDQHPQSVQAFLDASMRGWKYAFAHEDELIDYIYDLTQRHSKAHLKFEAAQMRKLILPDLIEPGYMYEGRWRYIAETYARVGLIPANFPVLDMLYRPDTGIDVKPIVTGVVALALVSLGVGLVMLRIYRLNTQLKRQMEERSQAQARLIESEARYRSLIELAPFPVVISRLVDNTIRYLNPHAEAQLKLSTGEGVGRPATDFYFNPADRERLLEMVRASGEVRDFEVALVDSTGDRSATPQWALMSARFLDYDGQSSIFVTFYDVTERRLIEEKLRDSEALYRSVLHASPDAVAITDLEGRVEFISPSGIHMFGYDRLDELVGRSLLSFVVPEHHQRATLSIAEIVAGEGRGIGEYRVFRKDGSEFHIESNMEVLRDAGGQPQRFVITARDITERQRAAAQAFDLAVEQERVKVLTAFIQSVSHEFRTPLSVISSSVYLLNRSEEQERRSYHAEKALNQIVRINRLVDSLLTMSTLDSGAPLSFRPTTLDHFVIETALTLEEVARERRILLHVECKDAPTVDVDSHYLSIALIQLLDNAVRYTEPDGRIDVRLFVREQEAVIEFIDTGVGISAEALPHIFERFWRQDRAHTTPGFGLGLTLTQKIVTLHGGRIDVESHDGQGSTFRVFLPLHAEDQPAGLLAAH